MVRIGIFYPNVPGARFDFDYYLGTHMPMSVKLLGAHPGYRGVSVERGLGGGAPDAPPAYIALCHFLFTSVEDFMAAFLPHAQTLQGDMPNYTDIPGTVQISEVVLAA